MASTTIGQVQLVLRLTLGLIFLVSAITKLRDPAAFVRGVLEYRVLPRPLARVYGWLLPFVELGAGLLLLSGFIQAVAAGLAVLMLVSFAIAVSINAVRGRPAPCHCFGQASESRIGWHTVVRDLALLLPAIWLLLTVASGSRDAVDWTRLEPSTAPALGLAVLLTAIYWLVSQSLDEVVHLTGTGRGVV